MNKEKEIGELSRELIEMACILSGECKPGKFDCRTCSEMADFSCGIYDGAMQLQKAGYGNVKQAVKEFADYLTEYAKTCQASGYDGIGAQDIQNKLKEFNGEDKESE